MNPPAGGTTAREPTVMTRPRPGATMDGTTARATVKTLVRFVWSMRSHVARSVSSRWPGVKPPTSAPRTSMRRRPRRGAGRPGSFGRGRGHHDGRPLDVLVAHLAEVEAFDVLAQLAERLVEGGQRP